MAIAVLCVIATLARGALYQEDAKANVIIVNYSNQTVVKKLIVNDNDIFVIQLPPKFAVTVFSDNISSKNEVKLQAHIPTGINRVTGKFLLAKITDNESIEVGVSQVKGGEIAAVQFEKIITLIGVLELKTIDIY
ncbi:MAG: hypothetical protein M0Q93_09430 [Terrimicrobiaceae bacterium]|nr:hypothetical protein [Terrimicrobiaceae bacterium]